ncbi:MAG: type II secretion system protein [Pedobacter sp.]|jgi:prepilin-type N-terminal cleavage/methylation domain-containing protein|uniref:type II secretion system protein n=1 Tax=Pedobacter sp. TaxID=1411316 RepID=UPI00356768E0
MKTLNSKKGFTLIELLIVIAIIAVLAVAFLPTILGAPAKGRDTARIADLQKIQKVLISKNLTGTSYPTASGFISTTSDPGNSLIDFSIYLPDFGGKIPTDPQPGNVISGGSGPNQIGKYLYAPDPSGNGPSGNVPSGTYAFVLLANVEIKSNANALCSSAVNGALDPVGAETEKENWCYAILMTK